MKKLLQTLQTSATKDKAIKIRFRSDVLAQVDKVAKELSLTRTGYIMNLLEKDIENRKKNRKTVS